MEKQRIESLVDFHNMLREHWRGKFLYRGEASAKYELRPKFGRHQMYNTDNDIETERDMLREFKRRATPVIQHPPENDWEWLALAQHFGMATRLLDWTENPLVAAFFATREMGMDDRVIYVLEEEYIPDANESQSPFEISEVCLYRPKHIAPRITSQGGVFTVHKTASDALDNEGIERWVIDGSCVIDINVMLYTYGIHEASVFPDLEGLAKFINYRFIR